MYKCKHFRAHELVPPSIYERFGERSFMFLDCRLLVLCDALREEFGSATINNYKWGGDRVASGLRSPDSPYYSPTSQHSFGRAVDILFKDHTAEEVRAEIKESSKFWTHNIEWSPSITLEDGVSWVHIDIRNGKAGVNSFKP